MKMRGAAAVLPALLLTGCGSESALEALDIDEPVALLEGTDRAAVAACQTERKTLETAWAAARAEAGGGGVFDPLRYLNQPITVSYFVVPPVVSADGGFIERARVDVASLDDCPTLDMSAAAAGQ